MAGQVGGRTEDVAVQGHYAYVAVGLRLLVLDVLQPITPTEVGSTTPFPQFVEGVAISGTLAYVADGMAGLRIVDVSVLTEPVEIGAYDTPGYAEGVTVAGGYAYVADGHCGLRIVDVSEPVHPAEVAYAYPLNYVFDVAVDGQYAYLAAAGAGLLVVDVSNPLFPTETGTHDTPGYAYGVDVTGDVAYVADGWEDLRVVSVTDPAHPAEVGFYNTPGWSFGVTVSGTVAYVADAFAGLQVVDVSDPADPDRLGGEQVSLGHAGSVAVVGNTAYVVDRNWGLRVVDVSDPGAPTETGFYRPLGFAAAVAVSGDYAYVAAATYGLRVVDISDPAHAAEVGAYDTEGNAIGVAIAANYAYVAVLCPDIGAGLHVIDVSDPAHPIRAGYLPEFDGCHRDLAFSGGVAYTANEWGLELIDVSSPDSPTLAGYANLSDEVCAGTVGVDVSGTLAYVTGNRGLDILDVSNVVSPTLVSNFQNSQYGYFDVAVSGTRAYVTGRNLNIIDVSDPLDPTQLGAHRAQNSPERVTVVSNVAYLALGSSGLHGIDVSDPMSPTLVFSYDTPGYAIASAVAGNTVYVADAHGGLAILETGDAQSTASGDVAPDDSPMLDFSERSSLIHYGRNRIGGQGWPSPCHQLAVQPISNRHGIAGTCVVTSTADSGPGALRECLENAISGDTITFDPGVFPPESPATITLQDNLPMIRCGNLTIDGSQAGVILDGRQIQNECGGSGLNIASDNNIIRGLQFLHFSNSGIWLDPGAENNTIGGDRTIGSGPMGQGNLISGNFIGINIVGSGTMSNTIVGNLIGTDVTGLHAFGNQGSGVQISHASSNRIGGTSVGERNIISASEGPGISMYCASGNVVLDNYIGTDVNGTVDLGNGVYGVTMEQGSSHNVVKGNLVSGNELTGVMISDWGSSCNTVVGNLIGTDAIGTQPLGNGGSGVAVGFAAASSNRIGGTSPGEGNVISGNAKGVELHGRAAGNLILGNLIGVNISGTEAISNGQGVFVVDDSSHSFIGGTTPAERNIISGNRWDGINLMPAERIFVLGNYIGTDASGTTILGNGASGVGGAAKHSTIQGNLISGNEEAGVRIHEGSPFIHLRANRIGVAADGSSPLPNGMNGVNIWAPSNMVGGPYPEDGNVIAFNAGHGVQVLAYSGNTIRRNSIYGNSASGIDLADGGNNMLKAPIITHVLLDSVSGTACSDCVVEIFSDEEDEGRVYEGSAVADGNGDWTWTGSPNGPYLTATATDETGNTSTFSAPQAALWHRIYLPLVLRGDR
jgi:parallel beta-helix repeat protein